MQVGIESFCKIENSLLIEPVCIVENKGLLRCYVYRLDFSIRYLCRDDPLVEGDEKLLKAIRFPHQAVKVQFVKPEWVWSYVEAGICLRYSHVTCIPANAVAILVWAKLYHKKGKADDFHTAQKVFPVFDGKLAVNEAAAESARNRSLEPTGAADTAGSDSKSWAADREEEL